VTVVTVEKILLGHGPTPWRALVDLAERMRATRDDHGVDRAVGEVTIRAMAIAQLGGDPLWVCEARWQADA
jgi:hypothetical protein